jgi:BolA protein
MIRDQIEDRLKARFSPDRLEVEDVSWQHAGHAGAPDGGESHFEVKISASAFDGQGRIAAHRAIHAELADLLAGPVHALQITLSAD